MVAVSWWRILLVCVLIVLSGFFAGLTLGTMSLDVLDLRVLAESGTEREKRCARRILPVRKRANFLLCSLLIGNTAANSALSIVSADLFGGVAGFAASTVLILYLGEIIPQALCHRYSLYIGSFAVPLIKMFMAITAIVSYPTSKILDYFLGSEPATRYNKSQLRSLVNIHAQQHHQSGDTDADSDASNLEGLRISSSLDKNQTLPIGLITSNHASIYARTDRAMNLDPHKSTTTTPAAAPPSEVAIPMQESTSHARNASTGRDIPPLVFSEPDASATPAPVLVDRETGADGTVRGSTTTGRETQLAAGADGDPAMFLSPASTGEPETQTSRGTFLLTVRGTKLGQFLFGRRNRGVDGLELPTSGSNRTRDRLGNPDNDRDKDRNKSRDKISDGEAKPLTRDEMTMLGGAFDFAHKKVDEVMTPLDAVFMLDATLLLNFDVMMLIFKSGHSRIPVYQGSRENIVGVLFTKDLILLDPGDAVPINTVLQNFNRRLLVVHATTPLDEMLNIFKRGGGHLALVQKVKNGGSPHQVSETLGIVTLEDLIEEIIGQDIVDETDVFTDNVSRKRVRRARSIDPEILKVFDGSKADEPNPLIGTKVTVETGTGGLKEETAVGNPGDADLNKDTALS